MLETNYLRFLARAVADRELYRSCGARQSDGCGAARWHLAPRGKHALRGGWQPWAAIPKSCSGAHRRGCGGFPGRNKARASAVMFIDRLETPPVESFSRASRSGAGAEGKRCRHAATATRSGRIDDKWAGGAPLGTPCLPDNLGAGFVSAGSVTVREPQVVSGWRFNRRQGAAGGAGGAAFTTFFFGAAFLGQL